MDRPAIAHLPPRTRMPTGSPVKGCTLTVKIMDGCLVLIPDSDDTKTIKQQYQRQQDQLSEIKLRMRELVKDYQAG